MNYELATIIVSVFALILSIVAIALSRSSSKKANELQEAMVRIERARDKKQETASLSAMLKASIIRGRQGTTMMIANEGQSSAESIRIFIDDTNILDHPIIPTGQDDITQLAPGAESKYVLTRSMGDPGTVSIKIRWDDSAGEGKIWESQLSL